MALIFDFFKTIPKRLSFGIVIFGVAVGCLVIWYQVAAKNAVKNELLRQRSQIFSVELRQKINQKIQMVQGVSYLFVANSALARSEFSKIIDRAAKVDHEFGFEKIVFLRKIEDKEKMLFEALLSIDFDEKLKITPSGDRLSYLVHDYIWPNKYELSLIGKDVYGTTYQKIFNDKKTFVMLGDQYSEQFDFLLKINTPVIQNDHNFLSFDKDSQIVGIISADFSLRKMIDDLLRRDIFLGLTVDIVHRKSTIENIDAENLLAGDQGIFEQYLNIKYTTDSDFKYVYVLWGFLASIITCLVSFWTFNILQQKLFAVEQAKLSEFARLETEDRFQILFNQAAVGVAQINACTKRFESVNKKFCDILGRSVAEVRVFDFCDFIHDADVFLLQENIENFEKKGVHEFRKEVRCINSVKSEVWVEIAFSKILDIHGHVDSYIVVMQDITERKKIEDLLRSNEVRLRIILQKLPVGLCLIQADGVIRFRNDRFNQISGYETSDFNTLDEWWLRAYPEIDQQDRARASWLKASNIAISGDGTIPSREQIITCKDKNKKSVEISGVVLGKDYLVTMVDLSQRKAAEEEVKYLVFYDPLTSLPNRRLLLDRLQQALATSSRHNRYGALILVDLDNFKTINETQGHDQGDILLLQVAQRLKSCLHEDDTLARQGGDEFVIVLEDLADHKDDAVKLSEEIGQKILTVLRAPYILNGEIHHSSLSMGITIFHGVSEKVDELLKRADLAMYQAKSAGRDTLRFYDPTMQAAVSARAAMESDMRIGLVQEQFELYYQPLVRTNRIIGVEALVRWRHPVKGYVSPGQFIPLAEETGMILALGSWVLRQACATLADWEKMPGFENLTIAVNASPRQFHQAQFVQQVVSALQDSGANGKKLKLELTESLLLTDVDDTIAKMESIKEYGISFSLDDFGTGYSSLAYLKRLPLEQLKIDRSFVRDVLIDPNDAAIARTVVALAQSLGIGVIAEGVETEAQRLFLAENQCHVWQGFLLSPPIARSDIEDLVRLTNRL